MRCMLFSATHSTSYQACQNKKVLLALFIKESVKEKIRHMETILDGLVWPWLKDSDDLLYLLNLSMNILIYLNFINFL